MKHHNLRPKNPKKESSTAHNNQDDVVNDDKEIKMEKTYTYIGKNKNIFVIGDFWMIVSLMAKIALERPQAIIGDVIHYNHTHSHIN